MKLRSILILTVVLAACAFASCERLTKNDMRADVNEGMFAARAMPSPASPPPMAGMAAEASSDEAPPPSASAALTERKLMRSASLAIEVRDLEKARATTTEVVTRVGGFIADANAYEDNAGLKSLTVSLRVPALRLDEALAAIKKIGRVTQERVGAEDVTEQYIDLEARLDNAKKLEQRLLVLLESKASRLKDLLDTERELARVRTDIETMEGRKRFMDNRINLSTIELTFSEPRGFGRGIFAPLAGTFQHALTTFTASLASLIVVVSALIPWAVVVFFCVWIVIRIVRARRRKKAVAAMKVEDKK